MKKISWSILFLMIIVCVIDYGYRKVEENNAQVRMSESLGSLSDEKPWDRKKWCDAAINGELINDDLARFDMRAAALEAIKRGHV